MVRPSAALALEERAEHLGPRPLDVAGGSKQYQRTFANLVAQAGGHGGRRFPSKFSAVALSELVLALRARARTNGATRCSGRARLAHSAKLTAAFFNPRGPKKIDQHPVLATRATRILREPHHFN